MVLLSRLRNSVFSELRRKVKNVVKKVEEVSKISGVSKRTLQYYDDEGILPVTRSKENYRLYDDKAMEKLWKILWYKEMGFKLNEIKAMLAISENEIESCLEQKIKSIGAKIHDLEKQRLFIRYIEQNEMIPTPEMKGKQTYKEQIRKIKEEI